MHKVDENPRTELHIGKNAMEVVGRGEAKISASMTGGLAAHRHDLLQVLTLCVSVA